MCGIMGYFSFAEKLPEKKKIEKMFELLETRGEDASGFAFIKGGELVVHKAPIKSSDMIKTIEWEELELPKMMIFHTRLKTQGDASNNQNNHPLYNHKGLCLVHNGMIHNDEEIFAKNKRNAEVDSEAILAVLSAKDKGDKIKRVFDKLEGSFAFALIDKNKPDELCLVKKDNPIDLYFDCKNEIVYFCSERYIMQSALEISSDYKLGFNLGEKNFHFYEMKNNYTLIIKSDGVQNYQKYNPKPVYWDYFGVKDRKPMENIEMIECPYCEERTFIQAGINNYCDFCGSFIDKY